MRRGIAAMLVAVSACADILGIDDGKPRSDDASIPDTGSPDTTALPDASSDGEGGVVDAAPDVPTSPLACGMATCDALTQVCCRTGDPSDASTQTFACVATPSDCKNGLAVTCAESANCTALGHPGEECCGVVPDGGSIATSTACVAPGACKGVLLCQPGDDEDCALDAGQTCSASVATILGFLICR
jgi:hypothetical protein